MPEDRRKTHVTPVFKRGEKEDPGNHRPVSLTSIPGKAMEELIMESSPSQWWKTRLSGVVSMDSPRGNPA